MEFQTSTKGKRMLIYDGFNMHFIMSTVDGTDVYRCHTPKCTGRIKIKNNNVTFYKEHNHKSKIKTTNIIKEIKAKALVSNKSSIDIITDITAKLQHEVIEELPDFAYIRDTITRERNKSVEKIDLRYEDIPDTYRITKTSSKFLQYDSGFEDPERILIFYSEFTIPYIKNSQVLLVDGTFKSCPAEFFQIFTIHGSFMGKTFPYVYCLLASKKESIYIKLFEKIKELLHLDPKYIIQDYEAGIKNAISTAFPKCKICGCVFHYGQLIFSKIQNLGLVVEYKMKKELYKVIRMYLNLAFIPVHALSHAMDYIKLCIHEFKLTEKLKDFVSYFEDNLLNYKTKTIPVDMWNAYERVILRIPRTNNGLEAWHRTLNMRSVIKHPNLSKFIILIQNEEELVRIALIKRSTGKFKVVAKRIIYENKLALILQHFSMYKVQDYLGILHKTTKWKIKK